MKAKGWDFGLALGWCKLIRWTTAVTDTSIFLSARTDWSPEENLSYFATVWASFEVPILIPKSTTHSL